MGEQPFWHALVNGVLGGVVGLLAVVVLVFVCVWFWYRVVSGDKTWEAVYSGRHAKTMFFELRCKARVVPADPLHLGHVECWVKTPSGRVIRHEGVRQLLSEPNGVMAFIAMERQAGRYKVRWYAAREGEELREVARKRLTVRDGEPDASWMSREVVA